MSLTNKEKLSEVNLKCVQTLSLACETVVTRRWPFDRLKLSRQLDRLQYDFAVCDPVSVTLNFDLLT